MTQCLKIRKRPPIVKNTEPHTHKASTFTHTSVDSKSDQNNMVPAAKNQAPMHAPPSTQKDVNESRDSIMCLIENIPNFIPILVHFHI